MVLAYYQFLTKCIFIIVKLEIKRFILIDYFFRYVEIIMQRATSKNYLFPFF